MSADGGLWYVKMPDGDVAPMSLDELDAAFNAEQIDESVMVLPAGQAQWARLGTLLGLDAPTAPAPVAPSPVPNSLRPVSLDLSADLDLGGPSPFKPRSRRALYGVAVGALAFGLVVFAATRGGDAASAAAPAIAAAAPAVAAVAAPQVAAPPPADPPPPEARFSDDQKAKLLAADKARDDKSKARKKARGAGTHASPRYKTQGFTSGGNKYDPLNANP